MAKEGAGAGAAPFSPSSLVRAWRLSRLSWLGAVFAVVMGVVS